MKILILQLARLGDILLTWPTVRALRRTYPEAEIHLMVRPSYKSALHGLEEINAVHLFPSGELAQSLDPAEAGEVNSALFVLSKWLPSIKSVGFHKIINLSFSPLSSEITAALSGSETEVCGYTRQPDGFLAIPDDTSAYFFAQVGADRPNRFHVADLFASLVGLTLETRDWASPQLPEPPRQLPSEFVALHVGGSERHKQISVSKWISLLKHMRALRPVKWVLLGANAERGIADQVAAAGIEGEILNLCGDLTLAQSMSVISKAKVLLGPDSSPIHMASLVGTPVLNLSVGQVKFWETGPRSPGSVVLPAASEADLPSDLIADYLMRMIHTMRLPLETIQVIPGSPSYGGEFPSDFQWELVQAIYLGKDFPAPPHALFEEALVQLSEANRLMIEQLKSIKTPQDLQRRAGLLDRTEEVLQTIAKLVPDIVPIVRWYMTEKLRLGPMPFEDLLRRNIEVQVLLQRVLDLYAGEGDPAREIEGAVR